MAAIDYSKFVIYKKPHTHYRQGQKHIQYSYIPGLLIDNEIYEWKSYNVFSKEPTKIPKKGIKMPITKDIRDRYCGSKKFKKIEHPGFEKYFITPGNAYDVRYIVYIGYESKLTAYIYKSVDICMDEINGLKPEEWYPKIVPYYTESVAKYEPINTHMDSTSLLQLTNDKYVLIDYNITEFTIKNDTICKLYCPTPGSHANPCAFGEKYIYHLEEIPFTKIPLGYFDNLTDEQQSDIVHEYGLRKNHDKIYKYATNI